MVIIFMLFKLFQGKQNSTINQITNQKVIGLINNNNQKAI